MRTRLDIVIATSMLVSLVGLAGCADYNPRYVPNPVPGEECRAGVEASETFEDFANPGELDVLVVVDDSGDVLDEQQRLAEAFPRFLRGIAERGVSLRVGVTTTDATTDPGLAPPGTSYDGCAGNTTRIVSSADGDGWASSAACNVVQGENGNRFQRAFDVIERAVIDEDGGYGEFFRDGARRLVIVLSNEDDCSGSTPSGDGAARDLCAWNSDGRTNPVDFAGRLADSAVSREDVSLAIIAGPPDGADYERGDSVRPVCQSAMGAAYPGTRLYRAAAALGDRAVFEPVCRDDLRFALAEIDNQLTRDRRVTLCPAERLVQEPLRVDVRTGEETESVPIGQDGFIFEGATSYCSNGAVSLAAPPLAGADAVEMHYCVPVE